MKNNRVVNANFFKSGKRLSDESLTSRSEEKNLNIPNGPVDSVDAEATRRIPNGESPVRKSYLPTGTIDTKLDIDESLKDLIERTKERLKMNDMVHQAADLEALGREISKNKFTVAVVGEFSKGKSTFINNLFSKDFLPVANIPTTAMLTRIRYSPKDMLVVAKPNGEKNPPLPLCIESWDGYTATIDGNDYNGVAFVGLNSPWLKNGIEVIDTPGAGDLEEKRAALIGDALRSSDAAIITVSAEAAMSMSEKLFIQQRLISERTPFLMLVITKLDRIPEKQRCGIIEFVRNKLVLWNMDIPVFVPYDVSVPGGDYDDIIGMDKVVNKINSWVADPERKKLTENWICLKASSILESSLTFLKEQLMIIDASDEQRASLIDEKKKQLSASRLDWEKYQLQMFERGNECYNYLLKISGEHKNSILERLVHEVKRCSDVQTWWKEDYPYRIRLEMANMATAVENAISRRVSDDVKWFNAMLDKTFKTHLLFNFEGVADKAVYTNVNIGRDIVIDDISKKRVASKIGVAGVTIASSIACLSLGIYPIIATMGISTGATLFSDSLMRKKVDEQREHIIGELINNVPRIVSQAMAYSESRVRKMYNDIINEAKQQENSWFDSQEKLIQTSVMNESQNKKEQIVSRIYEFDIIKKKFCDNLV